MKNFNNEQVKDAGASAFSSKNNLFLCKKHAQQRMLRANKNLIPKGSKFKIKKIEIKEVRKRT